ncbi:hypothetical protein MNEG_11856 [Monoraphidium neglectum]|uniref:AAA+ ATPase domain-containing protein n=1 Tax=Monoraphidium neglectum TaxID=145388 RepID=A0A0D2MMY4_9CHLO|nr:hypothetical protein MNEG_11856 [Monoraphidium neglectum]KIY96105.1 hypothetical protein MNEG_11856 [Monoraphidium neglectum]|eukprot:XP_013895125.1 hypothetical protein MNEG_11856 [Monoraphidium neglectum]
MVAVAVVQGPARSSSADQERTPPHAVQRRGPLSAGAPLFATPSPPDAPQQAAAQPPAQQAAEGPLSRHRPLLPRCPGAAPRAPAPAPAQDGGGGGGANAAPPCTPLGRAFGGAHLQTPSRVPVAAPPASVAVGRGYKQAADGAQASAVTPRPGGGTRSRLQRPLDDGDACGAADAPATPGPGAAAGAGAPATPARQHLLSARRVAVGGSRLPPLDGLGPPATPLALGSVAPRIPAGHGPAHDAPPPPAAAAPGAGACGATPLAKPPRRCSPEEEAADREAQQLLAEVQRSALIRRPDPAAAGALLGPERARRWLRERLALRAARAGGAPSPAAGALSAGVLLFGPPGCGKTEAAFALAAEARARMLFVPASDVARNMQRGCKFVRALFKVARRHAPAVICFDDVDQAFPIQSKDEDPSLTRARVEVVVQLRELAAAAASAAASAAAAGGGAERGGVAAAPAAGAEGQGTPRGVAAPQQLGNGSTAAAPAAAAGGGGGREALVQPLFVIMTSSRPEDLDPGVAAAAGARLLLQPPGRETREEIITAQV